MATFHIEPLDRFRKGQSSIRRPREFTYFSFNDKHELLPESSESMTYYYPPIFNAPGASQRRVDLSAGFNTFVKKNDSPDEHLDAFVDTLQVYEERLLHQAEQGEIKMSDVRVKADFITWRGMMTKILTASFDIFNEFEMNATHYQGTIWIEEDHASKLSEKDEQRQQNRNSRGPSQEMMMYWGYKFESLAVLRRHWAEASREEIDGREHETVNNNAQYCSIVRTGIGENSLVLAGEVDAVLGEKPADPNAPIPWVELKTTQQLDGDMSKATMKLERKLLRFWAQSFLLGVPHIAVGYRTHDGYLTQIQHIDTQKIPQQVMKSTRAWDGNVCINFTAQFLQFLKSTIKGDGVWRISRAKGQKLITVVKVADEGTGDILKGNFKAHRDMLIGKEISAALGS